MSKDLFLMMREKEIATSNFLPTKKEITKSSKEFAEGIVNGGNHNLQEVYSQALRLKESLSTIEGVLKNALPEENFEGYGLKGTYRSGGETLNYTEDEIYNKLKDDLDARVELLKLAQKQDCLDTYGNEVPKVSTTQKKSSLAISF
tara:strand:- start:9196 stop:9633 length:438 start_codon:yes stop_codon:yes gene_type:complete